MTAATGTARAALHRRLCPDVGACRFIGGRSVDENGHDDGRPGCRLLDSLLDAVETETVAAVLALERAVETGQLVGVGEAAALMRVSVQRLHVLRHQAGGGFPAPYQVLATGPIWLMDEVLAYDRTRNKTPGRRPT